MKFSMMSYTIGRGKKPGEFNLKAMCELTRELNMDAIDFVTTHGIDPKEVRKVVDDFGLKVCCYTFFARLNAPTPEQRQQAIDAFKEGIDVAVTLGTDKIMLPLPKADGVSRTQAQHYVIDGVSRCLGIAEAAGIAITVENFCGQDDTPVCTSDDFLKVVKEVPELQLTYDNGNILTGGEDPALSFQRTQDYVIHAHFKDWEPPTPGKGFKGRDGRCYTGALIGEGIVDTKACLQAMKDAGYEGYINIEYEGAKYTPEDATRRAKRYLDGLMTQLK